MLKTDLCEREGKRKWITGSKMRENGPQEERSSHANFGSVLEHGLQVASSLLHFTARKNKFTYLVSLQQRCSFNDLPSHP